ncbi:large ribosomal subunit protein mL52 [Dermacentor andersoni]|uniref:large ribosomal subunit protein mL52 n=1 Tax=Dermacentor andersoni TaxID=34620 RepID=UPI002155EF52|nr:39S ribosomal protein L52, mitochondrial-like [Dermacentor andersoni]
MAALICGHARSTLGKCFQILQGTVAKGLVVQPSRGARTKPKKCLGLLRNHHWRIAAGLPRRWNETREFADTPDWTFNDGRPTPLTGRQRKRYLQQMEYCTTIVRYLKEIKDAQEANVRVAQEEEEIKKRVASGKFRQKGIDELKVHQPNRTKQSAET